MMMFNAEEGIEVQSDMSGKGPAAGTMGREKAVCCLIRNPLILNNAILIFIS